VCVLQVQCIIYDKLTQFSPRVPKGPQGSPRVPKGPQGSPRFPKVREGQVVQGCGTGVNQVQNPEHTSYLGRYFKFNLSPRISELALVKVNFVAVGRTSDGVDWNGRIYVRSAANMFTIGVRAILKCPTFDSRVIFNALKPYSHTLHFLHYDWAQ
jgi:hypothetical protein